ncbi:glyoxylate/hydroxypyruvate reductase A [Lichenihabitans sp. Uapishka_5]|uniref:2-hydroxyacid dehydrogenase n=1 Tax=Lichenihabitans sp. Uapishka_5 TaxID=3037302 RepID=UPI0029E7DD7E|nr:glyoxylate/hydroxypyruvate reductase A [Lichenihabitans sp. Uapishka_5]MDX7953092.1 glyoxylate/hydroxypyruvate reductase A [Lichenihabitans sp. Uapishka_5]
MSDTDIILVAHGGGEGAEPWVQALAERLPQFRVQSLQGPFDPARVRYAVAWKHPPGSLVGLDNLQAIFSLGAGVDHLVSDPDLPDVPIIRVVDPDLTSRMSEWVLLHVLAHHRQARLYDWHQAEKLWEDDPHQPAAHEVRVGVMGLGVLGSDAARKLDMIGFDVAGWSRTPKVLDTIDTYAGAAELDAFLARTEILVVLLPLTPDTRGILNHALFANLARHSYFGGPILLNAGRGGLQDEAGILEALEDGTLRAATLDVFETEPLPQDSPLWHHPAVTVTPHNAAISSTDAVAAFIAGEIEHLEAGGAPRHGVDRGRAY